MTDFQFQFNPTLRVRSGVTLPFPKDFANEGYAFRTNAGKMANVEAVRDETFKLFFKGPEHMRSYVDWIGNEDRLFTFLWHAERALYHFNSGTTVEKSAVHPASIVNYIPRLGVVPTCAERDSAFYGPGCEGVGLKRTHKLPTPLHMGASSDGTGVFPQFQRLSSYVMRAVGIANPRQYPEHALKVEYRNTGKGDVCMYCRADQKDVKVGHRHLAITCPYVLEGRAPPWLSFGTEMGLCFLAGLAALTVLREAQVKSGYDNGVGGQNREDQGVNSVGLTFMDYRHVWSKGERKLYDAYAHFDYYDKRDAGWVEPDEVDKIFGYFSTQRRVDCLKRPPAASLRAPTYYSKARGAWYDSEGQYAKDEVSAKRQRLEFQKVEETATYATVWDNGPICLGTASKVTTQTKE